MRTAVLPIHPALADHARLPILAPHWQGAWVAEILFLLGAGVGAALATALLDFGLRIPGHAIIRAVFPMALGLALAPRRMGGMVMGASALGTAWVIQTAGFAALGAGAMTSLALTGPFLDLALWRARPFGGASPMSHRWEGWRLYLGFAVAGLGSNLAALTVRAGTKLLGLGHLGARPLAAWWPQAIGTYAVCGLLAGLISALVWFRLAASSQGDACSEPAQ
jgi:hypothetical protein